MGSRTIVVDAERQAECRRKARPPTYARDPTKAAELLANSARLPSASTSARIDKTTQAFRWYPEEVTAIDMALRLDVPHPPGWIRDLRIASLHISSRQVKQAPLASVMHRTALETLEDSANGNP